MSVDKFGRHSKRPRAIRGPKGDGFNVTDDGNYNIEGKRLENVGAAVNANDAVSMEVLESKSLVFNKKYQSYSAKGKRLTNVGTPMLPGDAVPMKVLDEDCLMLNAKKEHYDARGKTISNVAIPRTDFEVVTVGYMKDYIPRTMDDAWVFNGRRLSGIKRPLEDSDAVTKSYLEEHTPKSEEEAWNCKKKRLNMVASPETLSDAVNVNYFGERLGQVLHTMYKQLAPSTDPVHTMSKEAWIRTRVSEPFFGGPITKSMAGVL